MEAPLKDLNQMKALMAQGQKLLHDKKWAEAKAALDQVVKLDDQFDHVHDLLAEAYEGLGDHKTAVVHTQRARDLRRQRWQHEVEAEIRGQHSLMGEPSRREIP